MPKTPHVTRGGAEVGTHALDRLPPHGSAVIPLHRFPRRSVPSWIPPSSCSESQAGSAVPGAEQDLDGGDGKKGGSSRSCGTGVQCPVRTEPRVSCGHCPMRQALSLGGLRHKVLTEISLVSVPKCHTLCSFSHHQEECVPSSVSSLFLGQACDLLSRRDNGRSPTVQVLSSGGKKPCSLSSAQGMLPPRDPPPRDMPAT